MIEASFGSSFKRAFKKRIKGKSLIEKKFWESFDIFIQNPYDFRLRTHKLSGRFQELWSFSVEYDIRVIFFWESDTKAILVDIGTHDEVY